MKKIVFLVFLNCIVYGQNYLPLGLNNSYQILFDFTAIGPHGGTDASIKSYRVLSDSIIDGKRFFTFSGFLFSQGYYYHYDQQEQKIYVKRPDYSSIMPAVDFNVPAGDWFPSYIKGSDTVFLSKGTSYRWIFGQMVKTFEMTNRIQGFPHYTYIFAENMGLFMHSDSSISGVSLFISESELFSAILDTTIVNPIVLNITSLYPLINRPVNAFPFTIQSSYNTNLNYGGDNLVSSFYTEITQIRGEDTLGLFTYSFNGLNYAYITLMPQSGDRLLVRGIIQDTSIFYNQDTYPDSGYAEILVLPEPTSVTDYSAPAEFYLGQNFPNPFNPKTIIEYNIPKESQVKLTIFDVSGSVIEESFNSVHLPGRYNYAFDGTLLSNGIYFYRLNAVSPEGEFSETKKMLLIK